MLIKQQMMDKLVKDSHAQAGQKIQKKELGQQINTFLENLEKFQLLDTESLEDHDLNSRVSQDSTELNTSQVNQEKEAVAEEAKSL